jgi:hypothetical protein
MRFAPHSKFFLLGLLVAMGSLYAHPGASIVVDAQGQIFFADTGEGVWKIDTQGKLSLISSQNYHWLAIDPKGHFAPSRNLGDFDGGSFERITPQGSVPAIIVSSDYPVAVGADGGLFYVPFKQDGPRELVRRMSDGKRAVFTKLPNAQSVKPVSWVNGITTAPDGLLYATDNDAILRIDAKGIVSTFRSAINSPDCSDPLPGTPQKTYLRGLAVAANGTVYVAANGCRSVIAVPATGAIRTILQSEAPWSPTAVALSGSDIYVLEYLHIEADDRKAWVPRVRKVGSDGRVTTIVTIERRAR